MTELAGKTVVVTGAGVGIGRAIALALAARGARIAVTDLVEQQATAVAAEVQAAHGEARAFRLDVTDRAQVGAVVQAVAEAWRRLDIWVNNAGVSTMRPFLELTDEDWRCNMEVNARGAFLGGQAAARRMVAQDPEPGSGLRGRIINIASMAGKRGNAPFLAHYVASKFAVVGLTQAMAGELAAHRITVNAVCPGYVRTSMQEREVEWEARLRSVPPDRVRELYIQDTPLGRLETPADVAGVVGFLAGPAAAFITGEAVSVNGGAWMD
jgi:NAD(P)-dependent dehydrogenase (short-subunit alcohol dehydrogenase family)